LRIAPFYRISTRRAPVWEHRSVNARILAATALAVAGLLAPGAGDAKAAAGPDELALPWQVAEIQKGKVTKQTRRLYIDYVTGDCDLDGTDADFRRVEVKRAKRKIVLTVVVAKPTPLPEGTACPAIGLIVRKRVDLRGKLGKRQLRDGSYSPPRLVKRK
jgi:hypothetical protein